MKIFMRILNSILALSCVLLLGLYVWLLILVLAGSYSGADAITHIVYSVDSWINAIFG